MDLLVNVGLQYDLSVHFPKRQQVGDITLLRKVFYMASKGSRRGGFKYAKAAFLNEKCTNPSKYGIIIFTIVCAIERSVS
jgi:hypothetical protein